MAMTFIASALETQLYVVTNIDICVRSSSLETENSAIEQKP